MKRIYNFDVPTQVKLVDFDYGDENEVHWLGGIAYGDKVICGCCGGTFDIQDYWDDWDEWAKDEFEEMIEDGNPFVIFNYWVDISNEIKG